MYLRYHLLSCVILSLILFSFYSYSSLLVFIFGFFIDVDHYLYDLFRFKNISLISSYKMHMDKNKVLNDQLHLFHTVEFIILFTLLTFFYKNIGLLLISTGLILHLILDMIYAIYLIRNNITIKQKRALSLLFWLKRNLN